MGKYLVWCFNDTRTEHKTSSEEVAQRIYDEAIKSGRFSSVTMRKEERTHGYAIKSWSVNDGEIILH